MTIQNHTEIPIEYLILYVVGTGACRLRTEVPHPPRMWVNGARRLGMLPECSFSLLLLAAAR